MKRRVKGDKKGPLFGTSEDKVESRVFFSSSNSGEIQFVIDGTHILMLDLSPERFLMASKLLDLNTFLLATAADALVMEASGRVRSPKIDVALTRVHTIFFASE